MTDETIVAVYATDAHAEAAIAELVRAGVPMSDITSHAATTVPTHPSTGVSASEMRSGVAPAPEPGFWSSLFGGEPDHDTAVYDRKVESGATVVTVKVLEAHLTPVLAILENHHPIELDEHGDSYAPTAPGRTATATAMERDLTSDATSGASETISLAEESLSIGKRVVNRGGTRIRRFVVETPVEQSVSLHSEKVVLERRPVTDNRPVSDGGFTDKTIEMVEASEEAVISKTARVVEEVRLRKEATERVETVRDTVRKQQVAVDQIPAQTDPHASKI